MIWLVVYVLGVLVSWPIFAGWLFAFYQGKYPLAANTYVQLDRFYSFFLATVWGLLWPTGLLGVWLLTGRGRYGWVAPWRES